MQRGDKALPSGLPRTVRYVRILIAVQILRLIGLTFVPLLQNNTLPATFVIPTVTGDTLTAITAPIVAYTLGQGGPKTWAAALVWNALGLADLINAQTLAYLSGSSTYIVNNDIAILFGVFLAIAFHIAAIVLLLRKQTTNYIFKA